MARYRNYRSRNGLTPGINRRVGSIVRGMVFILILGLCVKFFKDFAFNPTLLSIIGVISFSLAGLFLYFIGFWSYLK